MRLLAGFCFFLAAVVGVPALLLAVAASLSGGLYAGIFVASVLLVGSLIVLPLVLLGLLCLSFAPPLPERREFPIGPPSDALREWGRRWNALSTIPTEVPDEPRRPSQRRRGPTRT